MPRKQIITTVVIYLVSFLWAYTAPNPVKVACIGNSITYGQTITDRESMSYPAQLQRMLGDGYQVRNFGKSGATLLRKGHNPYTSNREYHDALAFAPDIAVIHLGINDTDPRDWPNHRDEFTADYLALIDTLRAVNPAVRILVARLTPISPTHKRFKSGTRDWRDMVQLEIEKVADIAGVQLIDFEQSLLAYPHMFTDGVHPDAAGAGRLAHTAYSAITGNYGGLRLAEIYSDGMVLPHSRPLTIRGTADAGARIDLGIASQRHHATAGSDGKWTVELQPLEAGGPYTMTVTDGKSTLTIHDVLAGEVWLCSGQSNMVFMLHESDSAKTDIAAATDNGLHLFDMKPRYLTNNVEWPAEYLDSLNDLEHYQPARWQPASPETAARFSAIGYHFGKMLRDSLHIPIGLICNAVGGSTTESWIDRPTLEHDFPDILTDWDNNDFVQEWARGRAKKNTAKSRNPHQRHPYNPAYLFEAGIEPLAQYPISGVTWYQGESNAHNIETHERLFHLLTDSWRRHWQSPAMPFCFVQLSSMDRPSWTWFRDSQRRLADSIPHTYMAVSSDHGDSLDVHPRHKRSIGQRLARQALYHIYGHSAAPSGPVPVEAVATNGAIYLTFDYADGMHGADGQPIRTFEIAETDGLYRPADITVAANRIKLTAPGMDHPRFVRYGWQPFTRANLVNSSGLPASTFRMEAVELK